jgi:PIN domain nuclease of toxin-antitoxin system
LIYLDTHIVVWLYAGLKDKLSPQARVLINEHELDISPIVILELQYLYETERITTAAMPIITDLSQRIGLKVCDKAFAAVVNQALAISWTRDPFDRLIVSHASLNNEPLLSKDRNILTHYSQARW